jgi:RNA polymerase sigma factor (sigma-70 family)
MVLGVSRRILRNEFDAEDAFQKTFLVLARKAASVVKRESVGSFLFGVAYRTSLGMAASVARRRATELQVQELPDRALVPDEVHDWREVLDLELSRLPEKYRSAVVLCDLEGRTRREAASQLGIPEGTLSSRLATAHRMLAKRLARCGLALSAGGLAAILAQRTASAEVSSSLVKSVAKAAVVSLVAGPAPAVVVLGGLQTMLAAKWKLVVGVALAVGALAVIGVAYRSGDTPGAAQAAPPDKTVSELEALRKENQLLKLNLQIVLEKLHAQQGGKGGGGDTGMMAPMGMGSSMPPMGGPPTGEGGTKPPTGSGPMPGGLTAPAKPGTEGSPGGLFGGPSTGGYPMSAPPPTSEDVLREAETALKALRGAKDKESQQKAAEALDKAMKKLREQLGKGSGTN